MFVHLSIPLSVKASNDEELAKVGQYFKASKLGLGEKKLALLEKIVSKRVEEWEENTGTLRSRLQSLSEFLDGKREEVDFPFGSGDSSNIDVRYAAAQERSLRANMSQRIFGEKDILVAEMGPGFKRDEDVNSAENAINWIMWHDCNALDSLRDTLRPSFRDGTALTFADWERKIERGLDFVVYEKLDEFMADYPDAATAGCSDEQYGEIIQYLSEPDSQLHVEYELDFVSKNGVYVTVFPLAKFIWYPLFGKSMRDLDIYGYTFRQKESSFREMVKRDYYIKDAAESCKKSAGGEGSSWDDHQDEMEGITTRDTSEDGYDLARLVVRCDLDRDGIPESYSVIWSMDAKKVLRVERYGLRRNIPNITPWKFLAKDGRLLGESLLANGEDMYRELNALHRHRSNNRRLTDSVTMIAPDSVKRYWDSLAVGQEFKPGHTIWVPDQYIDQTKGPRQFVVQGTSRTSESLDEEQMVSRYLDGLSGISQGMSGRETAIDPRAPGNKTAMLLQRADLRAEDMIDEWKRSIPDFVETIRALYYQNSSGTLPYMVRDGKTMSRKQIRSELLSDDGIRFALRALKNGIDPASEMAKIAALAAAAGQFGIATFKPDVLIELWNSYVSASRIEVPERFMIKMEGNQMTMGGQPMAGNPTAMAQLPQLMQMLESAKGSGTGPLPGGQQPKS